MMKYLFATTNKAKIRYYALRLKQEGIDIVTLDDLKIDVDVEETGNDPVENALIKAKTYNEMTGLPTIALDDGLYLENIPLDIQPGTFVRRVGGKRLNDEEMLNYYIGLVNKYGENGELHGYFLKGVAIYYQDKYYTYEHKSDTTLLNRKSSKVREGYPLSSLQFNKELNKFSSELTDQEEKILKNNKQNDIFSFIMETINEIDKIAA